MRRWPRRCPDSLYTCALDRHGDGAGTSSIPIIGAAELRQDARAGRHCAGWQISRSSPSPLKEPPKLSPTAGRRCCSPPSESGRPQTHPHICTVGRFSSARRNTCWELRFQAGPQTHHIGISMVASSTTNDVFFRGRFRVKLQTLRKYFTNVNTIQNKTLKVCVTNFKNSFKAPPPLTGCVQGMSDNFSFLP